ncbi:MAG: AbrB family transcriptional regulator [Pseudomonadota bacterium]
MIRLKATLLTFAIAGAGAALFAALALPLPFLLGPMFACLAAALAGFAPTAPKQLSMAMRTILGVAVGASVTPELIGRIGDFAVSVALVPVFVALIGLIGYPYFRRACGFDRVTAYYAAMPGGLQDMILFGQEAGGDARALSLVHATRVLVIVALMPILLTLIWGVPLDNPPGRPATDIPLSDLAVMLACALIGWKGGERIGLFGAAILGPMALAAPASLLGLTQNRPPAEAILLAQFFIGLGIGSYYTGVTAQELRRVVAAALGYCAILAILALVFAEFVTLTGAAPGMEAALAFAPGGQAEMVVLAIVAGADMTYVVTLHLSRLIIVILGAPIAMRLTRGAENRLQDRPQDRPQDRGDGHGP